jgi:DNA-binding MarR family transcriptional regulator/GNAT superfamily N-acetyltransferase
MEYQTHQKVVIQHIGNEFSGQAIGLILPIQQKEFAVPVTLEGQPDLMDIEKYYHQSGGGFWGAFLENELLGTIGLINIGKGNGVIRKMFVQRDYRGKDWGIAQRLLDTLKDFCLEAGIQNIYLGTIDIMKAAARFYERNGFVRILRSEFPTGFPLMAVDNTFYHLPLAGSFGVPGRNPIERSGILALATRLQRMSEQLRKDGQQIYQAAGIAFEPKWFPVIYVLNERSPLSVVEIAAGIGYTHPSTISLLNELEKEDLVESYKDKNDNRKRLLRLTAKAETLIVNMKPVWTKMTRALSDLTATSNNLLEALNEVEFQMESESFFERTRKML